MTMAHEAQASSKANPCGDAFRALLVHVEPHDQSARRLEVAAALARRWDATLIGLAAEMMDPGLTTDPTGMVAAELLVAGRDLVTSNLERSCSAFQALTGGLKTQLLRIEDVPDDALARAARGADLIVAGVTPNRPANTYRTASTAELVLRSGRPVLIAPPYGGKLQGEAVVVAWKDTREARRALVDALPFLKAAQDVLVVEVCEHASEAADAEARMASVAEYLRRHGVEALTKVTVAPREQVADEIQRTARGYDADLIVAGGYGHTRLGEWVFGGVTHELLHRPDHFVLMSH